MKTKSWASTVDVHPGEWEKANQLRQKHYRNFNIELSRLYNADPTLEASPTAQMSRT